MGYFFKETPLARQAVTTIVILYDHRFEAAEVVNSGHRAYLSHGDVNSVDTVRQRQIVGRREVGYLTWENRYFVQCGLHRVF